MSQIGTVYILHFDQPFHHARHYVGFTNKDIYERFREHAGGSGAKLMAAVSKAKIGFAVSKTFADKTREFERKIKKQKNSWKHCPKCRLLRGLSAERHYRKC